MDRIHLFLLLLFLLFANVLVAQNKAVVLQNIWNNDLNSYNPQAFLDQLSGVLKDKLSVKDLIANTRSMTAIKNDSNWAKNLKDQIRATKTTGDAYFIAVVIDLRLPALNLGKFLFKNPPRTSKLTLTLHIYDTAANEVIGDTIINRGCVVRTIDKDKGSKFFYADYSNFMSDMLCHLEVIKKILQEKPFAKKQQRYVEIK